LINVGSVCKIKNIGDLGRGVSDHKMCYKPRTNIVRDEKGDFATYSHSILGRWRNHFYQVFNVRGVNNKTEIHIHTHTAEPLVPDPSVFEF
jgi:hypothetical protein